MSQVSTTRIFKKHNYSFVFAADETSQDVTINPNIGVHGEVQKIVLVTPAFTNDVTSLITFVNADGNEIFADEARARNNTFVIAMIRSELVLMGTSPEKFNITLSGVPGGSGGTVELTTYVEG